MLTSSFCYCSDQNWWDSHQKTTESRNVWQDLSTSCCFAGKYSLEIYLKVTDVMTNMYHLGLFYSIYLNLPAMGFLRKRAIIRNRNKTKTFSRQFLQSNQLPCPITIWHVDLSMRTVCTSTVRWKCKSVEWHRCRRPSINHRRECRKRRYTRRKWLTGPSPYQWSLPMSHLNHHRDVSIKFILNIQ